MTDYLYGMSLATQTKNYLLSMGLGFLMGFIYDGFRIIRLAISSKKIAVIISDLLYCVCCCFGFYIFLLTVNEGQFRFYLLLGAVVGFFVYYFSLGAIIFTFSSFLTNFIKKCFKRIFAVLLFPFRWIYGKIKSYVDKIIKKSRKRTKKLKNNSKTLLKLYKHLLYNLNVKKRVRVNDASEKEKE